MSTPHVSAVLVAWNSGAALAACMDSLRTSADAAGLSLELVVVDNGSTDGSVEALASIDHISVRNPLNAGYGVAAAQGIQRARGEWVLLVNPDVVVAQDFFQALDHEMREIGDDVASVVPELRFSSDHRVVNARGIAVDDIGVPLEVDVGAPVVDGLSSRDVLGGSSGCTLFRADAVRRIGGVEPIFFAYLEDVDLALRLQSAGYRARFVPAAVAWHVGSASIGEGSPTKSFLVARNRRILFRLHGPHTRRAITWRLLVEAGHGLVASAAGQPLTPWLGRLDAVRLRRYTEFLRRARREFDAHVTEPPRIERIGLSATLRRKRGAARHLHR